MLAEPNAVLPRSQGPQCPNNGNAGAVVGCRLMHVAFLAASFARRLDDHAVSERLFQIATKEEPIQGLLWADQHTHPFVYGSVPHWHRIELTPAPGGWWDPEMPFIAKFARALRDAFPQVRKEFSEAVRDPRFRAEFAFGISDGLARKGWGGMGLYALLLGGYAQVAGLSHHAGWFSHRCAWLPSLCKAVEHLLPSTKKPVLSAPSEGIGLQIIKPGGWLLPHTDPERVSIMQCLIGCQGAWIKSGGVTRHFDDDGGVFAFDNLVEHSAGNDGGGERVVVTLVVNHPEYDTHFDQLSPAPQVPTPAVDHRPLRRLSSPSLLPHMLTAIRQTPYATTEEALLAFAVTFDCHGGENTYPRKDPVVIATVTHFEWNTALIMHEYDWAGGQIMLKFKGQSFAVKLGLSGSIGQLCCETLQAPAFDSKAFIKLVSLNIGNKENGEVLQQWNAVPDVSQANKEATEAVFHFHVVRLLDEVSHAERDFSIRRGTGFPLGEMHMGHVRAQVVARRLALFIEHLCLLHLINGWNQLAGAPAEVKPEPLRPALPFHRIGTSFRFHDAIGNRAELIASVLLNSGSHIGGTFLEVGVNRGDFVEPFLTLIGNSPERRMASDPFHYCGVDPAFHNPQRLTTVLARAQAAAQGTGIPVKLYPGTSVDAHTDLGSTELSSISAVFVDGSHVFEDVVVDFELWWPKLRPGGILFGHDFTAGLTDIVAAVSVFAAKESIKTVHVGLDSIFWIIKGSS